VSFASVDASTSAFTAGDAALVTHARQP